MSHIQSLRIQNLRSEIKRLKEEIKGLVAQKNRLEEKWGEEHEEVGELMNVLKYIHPGLVGADLPAELEAVERAIFNRPYPSPREIREAKQ